MNYTKNYHLPQWVKSDRIMMDDFNRMCADMEAGLTQNAQTAAAATAAAKSETAAAAASAQSAAAAAQATADQALTKANAAYCPSYAPFTIGSYRGTGSALTVNVGFSPRFVIISGQGLTDTLGYVTYFAAAGGSNLTSIISFTSSGFTVKPVTGDRVSQPNLVMQMSYSYIAFR